MSKISGLRDRLSKYKGMTTAICMTLLVGAMATVGLSLMPEKYRPPEPLPVYYFDLNTSEVFAAPPSHVVPVEAPSGPTSKGKPAGVRAHVFACGSCDDSEAWVGYLQSNRPIPPEEAAQREQGVYTGSDIIIGSPDASSWYREDTPEGIQLININPCPADQPRIECFPTKQEMVATH